MAACVAFLGEASDVTIIGEFLRGLKSIKPHAAFSGNSFTSIYTPAFGQLDPLLCDGSHTRSGTMCRSEQQHVYLVRGIGTRLVPEADHRSRRL
jgi:hypothetical protein